MMIFVELILTFLPIVLSIGRKQNWVSIKVAKVVFCMSGATVFGIMLYSWLCNMNVVNYVDFPQDSLLIGANASTVVFTPLIVFIYILSHVEIFEPSAFKVKG